MILGIGTDICNIRRVQLSFDRFGVNFAETLCCHSEIRHVQRSLKPATVLAQIFSAKEAVAKSIGVGLHGEIWWDDIEVVLGGVVPRILISQQCLDVVNTEFPYAKRCRFHLSIATNEEFVTATALAEASEVCLSLKSAPV